MVMQVQPYIITEYREFTQHASKYKRDGERDTHALCIFGVVWQEHLLEMHGVIMDECQMNGQILIIFLLNC